MDRFLRNSLHHHTIIAMNISASVFKLIDVRFYLNFLVMEKVWPQTPFVCLIWWLVDIGFYETCCILTAWASIERHIFVFHDQWLSTRRGRFLVHYLPLTMIIIYTTSYYTWVIFFLPCKNTFDYTLPVYSASRCFFSHPILKPWEAGVHGCFTTLVVAVFSIGLLIRVLMERRRRHREIQWRKHRKLTIQLLSISSIFFIFNLPLNLGAFIQLCGLPFSIGATLMPYFFFSTYWLIFLMPFVCLTSLPHFKGKLKRMFCISHRRQATVGIPLVIQPTAIMKKKNKTLNYKLIEEILNAILFINPNFVYLNHDGFIEH
ncbi:unnamed protein product [Rotaria sp. Silwood2]|nr:unnamed protein product [Rotaria sp. Silwood2]CAF4342155.1 unnamed protein product [Rotaria sp. Silwood2]